MSGDCELDLRLDLPKLVLGFADVDSLVIQRGTWSMARRNLSLVWPESPKHGPGWGDTVLPCPTTACKAGETLQCWRLVGCYSTAKLAQVNKPTTSMLYYCKKSGTGANLTAGTPACAGEHPLVICVSKHPGGTPPATRSLPHQHLLARSVLLSMRSSAASSWLETAGGRCQPITGSPSCRDQVTRSGGEPSTRHSRLTLSPTSTVRSPRGSGK